MSAVQMFPRRSAQVHAEVMSVTPKLAEKWLGKNHKNRVIRRNKVESFARDMAAGAWNLTGQGVQFDTAGRLIDGQHRMLAVIKSQATVPMLVVYGLDPEVMAVIDTGSARTPGDMLGIIEGTKNAHAVAAIARMAVAWDRGFRWFANYKPTHTEVRDYVSDPRNAHIHRAAEVGVYSRRYVACAPSLIGLAFFLCARVDRVAAEEFFVTQLVESSGLRHGDPAHTLGRRLANDSDRRGSTADFNKLAYILTAWNHYRVGAQITKLQAPKRSGFTTENYPLPR